MAVFARFGLCICPRGAYGTGMGKHIYKILTADQWQAFQDVGSFDGAPVDLADGFIHFSTASQTAETAAKHFAGQADLMLAAVDESVLGVALKYEVSRGGALFPHYFATLMLADIAWCKPMPLGEDGLHVLPMEAKD